MSETAHYVWGFDCPDWVQRLFDWHDARRIHIIAIDVTLDVDFTIVRYICRQKDVERAKRLHQGLAYSQVRDNVIPAAPGAKRALKAR